MSPGWAAKDFKQGINSLQDSPVFSHCQVYVPVQSLLVLESREQQLREETGGDKWWSLVEIGWCVPSCPKEREHILYTPHAVTDWGCATWQGMRTEVGLVWCVSVTHSLQSLSLLLEKHFKYCLTFLTGLSWGLFMNVTHSQTSRDIWLWLNPCSVFTHCLGKVLICSKIRVALTDLLYLWL